MLKKSTVFIALILCFSQFAFSQTYKEQFGTLFDKKDDAGQLKLLQKWEKEKPDDSELYVAYFNYYIQKSMSEVINLSSQPRRNDSLAMTKTDDKTVAYLNSQTVFEKKNYDLAMSYINKGIEKFPNRLDMRFGKTHILGRNQDYKNFTDEIVKTLDYSDVNKNKWTWADDKPLEQAKKVMLDAIQDYVGQLFDADDEHAVNIKTVAEAVLKYYPDSVENLSNLAVYYIIKKDYDNALIPLLKAEKLAPIDFIVLNNIAWCYYNKGDKPNAVKYYEAVVKHGPEEAKAQAREKIKELKGN